MNTANVARFNQFTLWPNINSPANVTSPLRVVRLVKYIQTKQNKTFGMSVFVYTYILYILNVAHDDDDVRRENVALLQRK